MRETITIEARDLRPGMTLAGDHERVIETVEILPRSVLIGFEDGRPLIYRPWRPVDVTRDPVDF